MFFLYIKNNSFCFKYFQTDISSHRMGCLKLLCGIVLCMRVIVPLASASIRGFDCRQVSNELNNYCFCNHPKCDPFTPRCCEALSAVNDRARTFIDKQAVCECFQHLGLTIPILKKCGVKLTYKFSESFGCQMSVFKTFGPYYSNNYVFFLTLLYLINLIYLWFSPYSKTY